MNIIIPYSNFSLNEQYSYPTELIIGSPILIKGLVLNNGNQLLYLNTLDKIKTRTKNLVKVDLGRQFYIVKDNGFNGLVAEKFLPGPTFFSKFIGLSGWYVTLNHNKTPMWRDSTRYKSVDADIAINAFLKDFEAPIRDLGLTLPFKK